MSAASHIFFRVANRTTMVPLHRAGLAAWLGNPVTGWQLLVTIHGRMSGQPRPVPLGYIVRDGAAWVMAGYGTRTQWYRNVLADPAVELRLPGRGPVTASATEARDPVTRARIIPPLVRSMALPGLLVGTLPATASDKRILELTSWVPLVAIRPIDGPLVPGPDDPGGRGWVGRQLIALAVTAAVILALRRVRGRGSEGRKTRLRSAPRGAAALR